MTRRARVLPLLVVLAATMAACSSGGSATRTVLTDYKLGSFAASYFGYFPRVASVHAGDSVIFKQAWTGEPHTITFGTALDPLAAAFGPYIKGSGRIGASEQPALRATQAAFPSIFDANRKVNQTLATACFLANGDLPPNGEVCPHRKQPDFTGRETLFNSGFIPYQGNEGNRFGMKLADDIKPGDYFYYCALHGGTMGGFLRVVPKATAIDSQSALDRRAKTEINAATARLRTAHGAIANAPVAGEIAVGAFTARPPAEPVLPVGVVNEFEPISYHATVGQKVTFVFSPGPGHTVSFKAPRNLPSVRIDPGGYQINSKAFEPQGGPGFPKGTPAGTVATVDAGDYDGSFFLSSGYPAGAMRYSVAFTKAGTYPYVCLLHPRMAGTIVVT